MSKELEGFFAGLKDSLIAALGDAQAPPPEETTSMDEVKKSIEALTSRIEEVAAQLKPGKAESEEGKGDGEEPGAVMKVIAELQEGLKADREAMEKALDRLEKLERDAIVRKSIDGDDSREALLKRQGVFDDPIRAALAGRKVNLV